MQIGIVPFIFSCKCLIQSELWRLGKDIRLTSDLLVFFGLLELSRVAKGLRLGFVARTFRVRGGGRLWRRGLEGCGQGISSGSFDFGQDDMILGLGGAELDFGLRQIK